MVESTYSVRGLGFKSYILCLFNLLLFFIICLIMLSDNIIIELY